MKYRYVGSLILSVGLLAGSLVSTHPRSQPAAVETVAAPAAATTFVLAASAKTTTPKHCKKYKKEAKRYACTLLYRKGFGARQMSCLHKLWNKESGWNARARNPHSGAYGIPQAYPAKKMRSAGKDWRKNPHTQVRWGVSYIKGRYGTPCGAWSHSKRKGWY